MAIKKNKKPYRPLSEIYLKESFARRVPLLPRQTILGEDQGMAEILIQKDTGEDLPVYKVPNKVADQIISRIRRAEVHDTEGESTSVDNVIAKCLEIDGWTQKDGGQNSAVFREVVNAFESDSIELKYKDFKKLEALQTDKDNPVRNILLKDPGVHNPGKLLSEKFKELFVNPNDALTVLQKLWRIMPESDANVGPGELALTMISDAVKGIEGDLQFDFGLVEVKGNNAALGSGKEAVSTTYNELNKILNAKAGGSSIQSINVETQKKAVLDLINLYISEYSKYIANPRKFNPNNDPATAQLHSNIKTKLEALLKKVNVADNLQEIIQDIKTSGLPEKRITRTGKEDPGERMILLKKVDTLQKLKAGEITSTAGGIKSKFNPAVNAFFSNPNLSEKDKIEGIQYVRSSSRTDQKQIMEVATELLTKYPKLLTWESGDSYSDLNRFIGAIHVAEYQQEKKFKYIVFFNSDKKDIKKLPSKIVALPFAGSGNTFKEDVKRVFEFFKSDNINASVTLNVDETRGTVRVAIT